MASNSYILTILAREITPANLAATFSALDTNNFSLNNVKRLSGDSETASKNKACYELTISGDKDLDAVRAIVAPIIENQGLDICVIPTSFDRSNIKLAVFDMDSTLVQCECIDELAKRHGIGEQVSSITASAMRGEIDFNESFSRRMALLNGLSEEVLQDIADNLPLTEGVEYMMKSLKSLGYKTALFSGGFYFFANHLQKLLDIDYVYANNLEIVDGAVTGRVTGEVVNGEKKQERLVEVAKELNLTTDQVVACGDGANDLPMLKTAGLGVAFHAKPLVREEAGLSVSSIGLDGLLYILGNSDSDF
ncbi:MAG: phosphoserine phosphatase SerB [Lentisphaeraceae bacterium]|nr:phosphoserine phosphatase SerB [Lentisphaeraceae bacterium]